MRVLYDYQAFEMQKYGGISNCFVKLIENLPKEIDYSIAIKESDNIHLKDSSLHVDLTSCRLLEENFISKKKFYGRGFLYRGLSSLCPQLTTLGINRQCSINAIKNDDFDVFHPTFFHPYFLRYIQRKPFVLTVHDMIPELFKETAYKQQEAKLLLCKKAARIITVSERTKQDLIEMFNISEKKIEVIYHGAPNYPIISESRPIIVGRYILYVGLRKRYKSFMLMMKYLAPFLSRHEDIKVVCTGPSFSKDELDILRNLNMANRVEHRKVNDEELYNLYSNALCFIYPSMYEGFGIPILEAYSANCPVLLNNASCFPEIAQDAAIYFNLNENGSDLEYVMEDFLTKLGSDVDSLLCKQRQRLASFSWKESAKKLADVYRSLV